MCDTHQATEAAAQVQAVWGALDALIINAGTFDYLAPELLQAHSIDLTVVAPQSLQAPVTAAHAIPEQWTAETAAQVLVSSLPKRESELVLEVWSLSSLWPLPR